MNDAEFCEQLVKLLAGQGPLKLMFAALQETKSALLGNGFKFGSIKRVRIIEPASVGARMRISVPMFDPTQGHRMELRAFVLAHSNKSSRGRVSSWLEAVATDLDVTLGHAVDATEAEPLFTAAPNERLLVRQELFFSPPADASLTDSELEAWLAARLSGKCKRGEEHDFAGKARIFVSRLEGVLSP